MEIVQTQEMHQIISSLWKKYLAAEIINDILMEEIRDRLYLENVSVPGEKNSPAFSDGIAALAFGDRTEEIVSALFQTKKVGIPTRSWLNFTMHPVCTTIS